MTADRNPKVRILLASEDPDRPGRLIRQMPLVTVADALRALQAHTSVSLGKVIAEVERQPKPKRVKLKADPPITDDDMWDSAFEGGAID